MSIEQVNSVNNSIHKNRWGILYILVMLIFMGTLDGSIVNVALPVMAKSLNVTSTGIQLVATSYLVIISATILIFGRVGDIVGKTKVIKFGAAVFTLGSLFCGITNSMEVLIFARVIQAIGAAACMSTAQGIVNEVFPKNERGKAVGITGTFMALGALVGPPLGGVIVATTSWRYIFLINVPIGTIALFYCLRIFPKENKTAMEKFDLLGSVLSIFAIVSLFLAIGKGEEIGFHKPIVLLGLSYQVWDYY